MDGFFVAEFHKIFERLSYNVASDIKTRFAAREVFDDFIAYAQ